MNTTLPPVHPGAPGGMRISVNLRIVGKTLKAHQVEAPDNPRARAWIPRALTGAMSFYGEPVMRVSMPVWFYRKLLETL